MSKSFDGRWCWSRAPVPASAGATAIAFAREGASVVVAARRIKESEETVRLIEAVGGDACFVADRRFCNRPTCRRSSRARSNATER